MRILNCEPLCTVNDEKFLLSFGEEKEGSNLYQLYFTNNSDKNIAQLEIKKTIGYHDDYLDIYSVKIISEQVLEDIRPKEKILVGEVNSFDNGVYDIEFIFTLYLEDAAVKFRDTIKRGSLLPGLAGSADRSVNVSFENYAPVVTVIPIEYRGSEILTKAIKFAVDSHKPQLRKGTSVPYIFHPLETAKILAENNCSAELMAAGVIHDVIEDTDTPVYKIRELFGEEMLEVVLGASEPDKANPSITWKQRKQNALEYLKENASKAVQLVSCADKLSNMRSIYSDYQEIGNKLWSRFNAGYEEQKWYYKELLKSLKEISEFRMYRELYDLVDKVFGVKNLDFDV